jgi:hypothetical protein
MEAVAKGFATVFVTYGTHYAVVKLYNTLCVPDGLVGFLQGLVTTGSPLCAGGMEILKYTQTSYSTLIMFSASRIFIDMLTPSNLFKGAPPSHQPL